MNGITARAATDRHDDPVVFLIAGEPSGDALGGRLMQALRRRTGGRIRFAGLGGEAMAAEGLDSLFPIDELSVMGMFEVLPRVPRLLRRMRQTARAIEDLRPAVVVSIDAPAFCFGVWRRLRGRPAPLIHYVAPTVWAWRPGRAAKYARVLDHLMALLPFEPPYFERAGLACSFVGHPVLESGAAEADGARFRNSRGLDARTRLLCVLPGSRRGEVGRLLPHFGAAVTLLARDFPDLHVVVPTVPGLAQTVARACEDWPVPCIVVRDNAEKYDAMAASQAALAASGTVALELALAGVPMVIAYRMNPLTLKIVQRMVGVQYFNLINLLVNRLVIPELLQNDCRGDRLADAVALLLRDGAAREVQAAAARKAVAMLSAGDALPSENAADVVMRTIGERSSATAGLRQAI